MWRFTYGRCYYLAIAYIHVHIHTRTHKSAGMHTHTQAESRNFLFFFFFFFISSFLPAPLAFPEHLPALVPTFDRLHVSPAPTYSQPERFKYLLDQNIVTPRKIHHAFECPEPQRCPSTDEPAGSAIFHPN